MALGALAVGAGVAGLASGLFGSKKKTSERFTREYDFFQSPEQKALRNRTGTLIRPAEKAISAGFGPTYAALAGEAPKFASGEYLDPNAPGNRSFIEATLRPGERVFKEQTTPDLLSYIARGRGFGGERASDLFRQTYRDYTESRGDVTARALAQLAQFRTEGYQAAIQGAQGGTDAFIRLQALMQGLLPQIQVTGGTGETTVTPPASEVFSNALLMGIVGAGAGKQLSK